MPSRAELVARANVLGIDTTTAKMANDSALEQRVLWNEKRATAVTGTIATTTLTSTGTAVSDGDTVTLGSTTYTAKTALTGAAAFTTITTSGVFSDGETILLNDRIYTMRTTLSTNVQVRDEILIGAAATNSLDNIKTTINGTGQGTTTNLATLGNFTLTAGTKTASTLIVSAKQIGTYGNSFLSSTTAANATVTSTVFAGGAVDVANQVLIGSTADGSAFLTNFKAALLGTAGSGSTYSATTPTPNKQVTATTLTGTTLLINSLEFQIGNADIATTETSAQLSFTSTVMASGAPKVIVANANKDQISGDAETLV